MLAEIVAHKRKIIAESLRPEPLDAILGKIEHLPPVQSLAKSTRQKSAVSIIGEIKRRSPSKGQLADSIDVAAFARTYDQAGVAGISVLTDEKYFSGSIEDLRRVRAATSLPILRKDFIVDTSQVYESRLIGADAILLIVAALDDATLSDLYELARRIGLEILVEVHTADEIERALEINAEIIGINNRDLSTFVVNLATTEHLRPLIPPGKICIAESGIHSHADMQRVMSAGVDAVLIGESLMTARDPARQIHELLGRPV
jgi:indole-3-glycerol phosphate synthase